MLKEKFKNKGFTLIEIIVVIVILAVLMAVAVPSVMSYINPKSHLIVTHYYLPENIQHHKS